MKYLHKLAFALIAVVNLSTANQAFGQAYVATNHWLQQAPGYPAGTTWEQVYSQWVSSDEVNEDFFVTGKHHIIGQEDCKKAAVGIRCSFAADHDLPCEMLGGTLTNSTPLPGVYAAGDSKQVRVKKFLTYLLAHVSVQSVSRDSVPIKISAETLTPGAFALFMPGDHRNHTITVKSVDSTGYLRGIYGTDEQSQEKDKNTNYIFERGGIPDSVEPSQPGKDGFRKWRHYSEVKNPEDEPGYDSVQQYSSNFREPGESYGHAIERHVWQYAPSTADKLRHMEDDLCHQVKDVRTVIVGAGQRLLEKRRNSISGNPNYEFQGAEYDENSTPSRDSQIKSDFDTLQDFLNSLGNDPQYRKFVKDKERRFEDCSIVYGSGFSDRMTLADFEEAMGRPSSQDETLIGVVSNNPNSSLKEKWGVNFTGGSSDETAYSGPIASRH
ncbi:unnamed protein product [Sphagnum balticum]